MEILEKEVAEIFDHMSSEYDDIKDLWYSWLMLRIQNFITTDMIVEKREGECLDVGCGTGFQTFLFSKLGINSTGIDISEGLIREANRKHKTKKTKILKSKFGFINDERIKAEKKINQINQTNKNGAVTFKVASATNIPFDDKKFQFVNCIGSVISFIEDYKKSLTEIHRVLRPDGVVFLEFENKYNCDLFWTYLDSIFNLKLGYETEKKEAYERIFTARKSHIKVEYPFSMHNEDLTMNIWLFNTKTLIKELKLIGFKVEKIRAIHSITNFIPSTMLDDPHPSIKMIRLFNLLSKLETKFASTFLINKLGCSTYLKLKKISINS
jgi:ubiquinone/menaquinone biosynthesis C-methylase UbiE